MVTYWWKILIFGVLFVVLAQMAVDGATIQVPYDIPSIQGAVERARPGDTILIRPGVYHERVVITKSLTMIGYGSGEPSELVSGLIPKLEGCPMAGCGESVLSAPPGGPAVEIRSDNVKLQGIRLEAADTCLVLESTDRASVNDNTFGDCHTCIAGFDTVGTRIEDNSFIQCRKTALQLTSTTDTQIVSNRFLDGLTGIRGDGGSQWRLQENRFQNLSIAVNFNGMIDSAIESNALINCTLGYLVISSRNTIIGGDKMENTTQYLFLLTSYSTDVTVETYGNATTISKDIDSSSNYRIGKISLTGTNFAFSLSPQSQIEGYQIASDRFHISFFGSPGGKKAKVKLEANEDLTAWERVDPFTFGFYRVDGKRPLFTGSTYINGNLVQTSTTLEDSTDGTYSLMAKRRVPFGITIEGIALVIVILATVAAFALHRKRL